MHRWHHSAKPGNFLRNQRGSANEITRTVITQEAHQQQSETQTQQEELFKKAEQKNKRINPLKFYDPDDR